MINSISFSGICSSWRCIGEISLLLLLSLFSVTASAQTRQYRGMTVTSGISAGDIDALGQMGPNIVRYQLTWQGADNASVEEYKAWLSAALDEFDSLKGLFESYGMQVVLDLHTPPGGFADRDPKGAQHRIFSEAAMQTELVQTWRELAVRYKDNAVVWAYELVNEPAQRRLSRGVRNWNGLAQAVVRAIREVDKLKYIVIQPVYGDQNRFRKLRPLRDSRVIYSFHMYFPWDFIHQGVYPEAPTSVDYSRYGRKALLKSLAPVTRFLLTTRQRLKRSVKMYVGEFTVTRWAPGSSSYDYLKDLISIFERFRWHWTYHAWREADVWSVEHTNDKNDPNPSAVATDRFQLLKAYFDLDGSRRRPNLQQIVRTSFPAKKPAKTKRPKRPANR